MNDPQSQVVDQNGVHGVTSANQPAIPGVLAVFGASGLQKRATADLTQEDLSNIYVAKIEAALRERIRAATDLLNECSKAVTKASRAVEDYLNDQRTALRDSATTVLAAIREFGLTAEVDAPTPIFESKAKLVRNKVTIVVGTASSFSKSWTENAPAPLMTLHKAYEDAQRAHDDQALVVMQARSALNNIASAERQARAAVTSKILSSMDGGEELLAQVEASIDTNTIVENLRTI